MSRHDETEQHSSSQWAAAGLLMIISLGVGGALSLRLNTHDYSWEAKQAEFQPNTTTPLYNVSIHQPNELHAPVTLIVNADGKRANASCTSCHSMKVPNTTTHATEDLKMFHQGLVFQHGPTTCLGCHNNNDYDTLKLSDGKSVLFKNVLTLCAQCHGPQYRDYKHGAHGGMSGYWDLTKGPRTRNVCTDCHDPHAPKYRGVLPAPPPQDRFLPAEEKEHPPKKNTAVFKNQ
jgi:hypothetical protein